MIIDLRMMIIDLRILSEVAWIRWAVVNTRCVASEKAGPTFATWVDRCGGSIENVGHVVGTGPQDTAQKRHGCYMTG